MNSVIVLDSSDDECESVKNPLPVISPVPSLAPSTSTATPKEALLPPKEVLSVEPNAVSSSESKRKRDTSTGDTRKRIKPTLISATIDRSKFEANSPVTSLGNDDETISATEIDDETSENHENENNESRESGSNANTTENAGETEASGNSEVEKSIVNEIEENPLTPTFTALLEACKKADSSNDMTTLLENKLLKYYHSVHPDFVTSKGFCRTVKGVCEQIEANPELVYYQLKTVVEELKVRRKSKTTVMCNEDVATTGNERKDRQIRLLSRGLLTVTKRIAKLEETDVDLGDEDNSAYLQLERLKKHACKIYDKICDLTGESKHAHRTVKKPVNFQGTCYPQFNRTLQTFVNRTNTFPDFFDVLRCLEHCNVQYGFGLRNDDMKKIAQDAFLKIGKLLQNRRKADLYETVSHFTGILPDPALKDETLSDKLKENQKFHAKIGSLIDRYAKEQEMAAEVKDKIKISSENEENKKDTDQKTEIQVTSNGKINEERGDKSTEKNKSNPATPSNNSTSDKENDVVMEIKDGKEAFVIDIEKLVPVAEIVISDEDDS